MRRRTSSFKIDDSAITEHGFTFCGTYPTKFTGNNFILTNKDTLCVKVYSNNQTSDWFAAGFGQFSGKDWIHVQSGIVQDFLKKEGAKYEYNNMLARAPEHAQSMDKAPSGALVRIMQFRLGQLTLRTGVVRKSLRKDRKSVV